MTDRRRSSVAMSVLCLSLIGEIHATMQIAATPRCTVLPGAEIVFASTEMSHWQGIMWH
jgi:hypothetical protein